MAAMSGDYTAQYELKALLPADWPEGDDGSSYGNKMMSVVESLGWNDCWYYEGKERGSSEKTGKPRRVLADLTAVFTPTTSDGLVLTGVASNLRLAEEDGGYPVR